MACSESSASTEDARSISSRWPTGKGNDIGACRHAVPAQCFATVVSILASSPGRHRSRRRASRHVRGKQGPGPAVSSAPAVARACRSCARADRSRHAVDQSGQKLRAFPGTPTSTAPASVSVSVAPVAQLQEVGLELRIRTVCQGDDGERGLRRGTMAVRSPAGLAAMRPKSRGRR
jgi:hypothetical protein